MTRHSPPPRPAACFRATRRLLGATLAGALATAATAADVKPFDYHATDATLIYTIEISGQAQTGNPAGGEWSRTELRRSLQGTLHLKGQRETFARLDNPGQQIARAQGARQAMAGQMPAMEKIAEECGDDDNCAAARVMALVNGMSSDGRKALVAAAHGPAAKLSEHSHAVWMLDGKTACSIRASSQGSTHVRSMNDSEGGHGYLTYSEKSQGQGSSNCLRGNGSMVSAEWNGDAQALDITLPGLTLTEQWKRSGGETGSRSVTLEDVELEHLRWSGKGTQSGQQTRHIQARANGRPVPATMTIRWTFTPGRA